MTIPFQDELITETFQWLDDSALLSKKEVTDHAKMLVLDTLACVNAAYLSPTINELESNFSTFDPGPYAIHHGPKMSALSLAQLFAYSACWHEACEGHASAHGRPGIATLAAIYPFASRLSWGQFLEAFVYGYEMSVRFAQMLRIKPGMHVDGNWPSLGATVAVGKCLALSNAQLLNAINITGSQIPMSLYLPIEQGSNSRNSYLGHAAVLGIQSAMAALTSLTAPRASSLAYAQIALGNDTPMWNKSHEFEILNAYIKPFAAVRHVHYGAIAAMELKERIDIQAITEIVLEIYEEATIYCGNRNPQSAIQAQFSLSFGIAAALVMNHLSFEIYDPNILFHPEVRRIEKIIQVKINPELTRLKKRGARLSILEQDRWHHAEVGSILGDANRPMSTSQIKDKFMHYSQETLGTQASIQIWDKVTQGELSERAWDVLHVTD